MADYDADERSFLINPHSNRDQWGTTRQFPLPRAATLAPPVKRHPERHCQNNCEAPTLAEERRTIMRH